MIEFDETDYSAYRLDGLPNESHFYHGQIIKWAQDLKPYSLLLSGEKKAMAPIMAQSIGAEVVETTGLGDVDIPWDFNDPPHFGLPSFELIISQAIIEHILDPFSYVESMAGMLGMGGHLIIHTVMPGFPYHRSPIDCLRFFPDWFEATAKKLNLGIMRKAKWQAHLFYMLRRNV